MKTSHELAAQLVELKAQIDKDRAILTAARSLVTNQAVDSVTFRTNNPSGEKLIIEWNFLNPDTGKLEKSTLRLMDDYHIADFYTAMDAFLDLNDARIGEYEAKLATTKTDTKAALEAEGV